MILVFALIGVTLILYATERLPLEVTSLGVVCALMVLFQALPVRDEDGANLMTPGALLGGFANPALLTVLALLILGEGLNRTGSLDRVSAAVHGLSRGSPALSALVALLLVAGTSAVLNNIPVVVIFIPIMQALAVRNDMAPSRYMMPLSFAAILGGMTTLIGSSTNLLVSSALIDMGERGFGFFSFTIPGLVVAGAGLVYVIFALPRLLPERHTTGTELRAAARQFKAQIEVAADSPFAGMRPVSGFFPKLPGITVLSVQRGAETYFPPYDEDLSLADGDVMVIAATRDKLTDLFKSAPDTLRPTLAADGPLPEGGQDGPMMQDMQALAEVMVPPNSRLVGLTLDRAGFRYRHACAVLGVERRSRMLRRRPTDVPLEAGDILLIQGRRPDIEALRGSQEVVLLEWSAEDLPQTHHATRAVLIFLGVVGAAASGLVPTEVAALTGATAMILSGALNLDEAIRAIDRKIILLIAAALALGSAMQATGGADFLALGLLAALGDAPPAVVLSAFFMLVAVLANILSTKATAVLFTPIAAAVAHHIGVGVEAFAVAVVFAANCSFASPVGYQTNLLVMAPGGYRFLDFVKAGAPLMVICWLAFSLFAPLWFDL
ncbi:SLC13 family permease [Marivibrio halodurans]|uniref:SLC13 family permease n=2 Tax=Marivibrio halodurans TaxID=2039722 RepID=A0A8J7V445_9PROT|nr:SLC13 family permease [Marivibrio halodurans]